MTDRALEHLRVVELSDRIAGSYCAKFLADFGADVVKVERPVGGDPARRAGPYADDRFDIDGGGLYLFLNTNKKSVTLNADTATGAAILKELLRDADVLVETMRPGVLASWGLPPDGLEKLNPNLVVTSVTDFGQYGPYRDLHGADIVHWALGSLLFGTGLAGREPIRIGDDISEFVAGLNAAGATLGALYGRENGGAQSVDLSVLESLMTVLPSTPLGYSYSGVVNSRQGNRFPITIVPCKDGYIGFYTMLQHQWEFLTVLLEMPELQDDERFATPMARFQHADEAMELLTPWFRDRLADDIVERGQELRIPIVKVANAEDVVNNPQFKARGFLTDLGNAASGEVTGPGRPFNLEGTPWRLDSPAPSLGQHNQLVYCNRLGFSKGELVILSEQGVL